MSHLGNTGRKMWCPNTDGFHRIISIPWISGIRLHMFHICREQFGCSIARLLGSVCSIKLLYKIGFLLHLDPVNPQVRSCGLRGPHTQLWLHVTYNSSLVLHDHICKDCKWSYKQGTTSAHLILADLWLHKADYIANTYIATFGWIDECSQS